MRYVVIYTSLTTIIEQWRGDDTLVNIIYVHSCEYRNGYERFNTFIEIH